MDEPKLKRVMATFFKLDPSAIGPDSTRDTIAGWDSLKHINLILALEEEFHVSIPEDEVEKLTSYTLIKLVLEEQLGLRGPR